MSGSVLTWWSLWLIAGGCGVMVVVVLGLWLTGRLKRRVGTEPHCRKCNYPLTGLESDRCPECGTELVEGRTVILGRRKAATGLVVFANVLLIVGLAAMFLAARAGYEKTPWFQLMPLSMVQSRAATGTQAAIDELLARYDAKETSDTDRRAILDTLIEIQGNPALTWNPELGKIIETARKIDLIQLEPWHRYLEQMQSHTVKIRPKLVAGETVYTGIHHRDMRSGLDRSSGFSANEYAYQTEAKLVSVRWDNGPVQTIDDPAFNDSAENYLQYGVTIGGSFELELPSDLSLPTVGKLDVELAVMFADIHGDTHQFTRWQTLDIEMFPPGDPATELIDDETLRGAYKRLVEPSSFYMAGLNPEEFMIRPRVQTRYINGESVRGTFGELRFTIKQSDTSLAGWFQLWDGSQLLAESKGWGNGQTQWGHEVLLPPDALADLQQRGVETLTFVYRPDAAVARQRVRTLSIWNRPFVIGTAVVPPPMESDQQPSMPIREETHPEYFELVRRLRDMLGTADNGRLNFSERLPTTQPSAEPTSEPTSQPAS